MNKLILAVLASIALAGLLHAGEQTLILTPQTLNRWIVTGADGSALGRAAGLALPGGAQLSRRFGADLVSVQLNTKLIFGLAGEDFPTLEVGPAALVFSREGMQGRVILVVGDNAPVQLPFPVKLNIDGTNVDPIDVQLAYERSTGNVIATGFGQTLRFVAAPASEPVEVVVLPT